MVWQFDQPNHHLSQENRATGTIGVPIDDRVDLAPVIGVSAAASGETVLERVIETLMLTAIEHAGAKRGLLVLRDGGGQRVVAEATTGDDTTCVRWCDLPVSAAVLPESVLYHVLRTQENVFLDDAAAHSPFATDPYIREHRAGSILCLPVMNHSKLIGVLYLENNPSARVFTPTRIAIVRLIASQAAIAFENAQLYRAIAEREAKIRRLVDANIVGIVIGNAEGDILDANDAFLEIVGYERDDLVSGRFRLTHLTPPEGRAGEQRVRADVGHTECSQPLEREYIRKDGSKVSVLVRKASFDGSGKEEVAFVLDRTESTRAEEKVRESERRYSEAQTELAHVNRVDTVGQLAASIAHEVAQPIAATVTNAEAGLRWLSSPTLGVEQARRVFRRIVNDGNRAGDVLGRVRELMKKSPPCQEWVDINKAIREVIEITRGEAWKHGASIQTHLADRLPRFQGDRIQLRQVLLNLIVNAIEAISEVCDGARELVVTTGEVDTGCLLVTVRDSGPGIAAESIDRVFVSFYTTKPTGLGLGLSICRAIIEGHGGQLWASANVPRGAVFQFTLPANPTDSS
jgi:PAS domain S-box-containing protein